VVERTVLRGNAVIAQREDVGEEGGVEAVAQKSEPFQKADEV
jgi:hypothetical protein